MKTTSFNTMLRQTTAVLVPNEIQIMKAGLTHRIEVISCCTYNHMIYLPNYRVKSLGQILGILLAV